MDEPRYVIHSDLDALDNIFSVQITYPISVGPFLLHQAWLQMDI